MDNQELKIKFDEIQRKIDAVQKNSDDLLPLLKEKYELLKIGFNKIKNETSGSEFNTNPKKYSTLLSYINTMKDVALQAGISFDEINSMEAEILTLMKSNNMDWLLNK